MKDKINVEINFRLKEDLPTHKVLQALQRLRSLARWQLSAAGRAMGAWLRLALYISEKGSHVYEPFSD